MSSKSALGERLRRLSLTISDHVAADLKHARAQNQARLAIVAAQLVAIDLRELLGWRPRCRLRPEHVDRYPGRN